MSPRVWLITGASSGLGLELALYAASQGDMVIGTSRTPQSLSHLTPKGIHPAYLDQSSPLPSIQAAIEQILTHHPKIDILINNAANVQTGTLEETSPSQTLTQYTTNVFGPLNLYRAILPHFRAAHSGILVTIGSMASHYPMRACNLYNSSKAALRILSLGLADEIAEMGIKHCLVEPGFFRTNLLNPSANIRGTENEARLPEYEMINAKAEEDFAAFDGRQRGDPVRGAEIIYELLTGTGCAEGREMPAFLPLGSDACEEIEKAASKAVEAVEEWRDVSVSSDFPAGE